MTNSKFANQVPTDRVAYGPDKMGRMWDHNYGDTEFHACIFECGTQRSWRHQRKLTDYWLTVDEWFERMYPDRWDSTLFENRTANREADGDIYFTGQMGFKIAFFHWLGENNGTPKA